MDSTNEKTGNIGSVHEDREWHKWILCQAFLRIDEEQGHQSAEDNQTYHGRRAPRKRLPAEIETEEQHQDQAEDGDASKPIDGFKTVHHACPRVVDVQEEQK